MVFNLLLYYRCYLELSDLSHMVCVALAPLPLHNLDKNKIVIYSPQSTSIRVVEPVPPWLQLLWLESIFLILHLYIILNFNIEQLLGKARAANQRRRNFKILELIENSSARNTAYYTYCICNDRSMTKT